jgi:hypothetical protein
LPITPPRHSRCREACSSDQSGQDVGPGGRHLDVEGDQVVDSATRTGCCVVGRVQEATGTQSVGGTVDGAATGER